MREQLKHKTMTTTDTKMTIGYQYEIAMTNGTKIMAAKGRQIVITLENDLYNVWAFTLRGVNFTNEAKINGVFADKLQQSIKTAALA